MSPSVLSEGKLAGLIQAEIDLAPVPVGNPEELICILLVLPLKLAPCPNKPYELS